MVVFLGGKNIVAATADEKEGRRGRPIGATSFADTPPSLLLPPLPSLRYD